MVIYLVWFFKLKLEGILLLSNPIYKKLSMVYLSLSISGSVLWISTTLSLLVTWNLQYHPHIPPSPFKIVSDPSWKLWGHLTWCPGQSRAPVALSAALNPPEGDPLLLPLLLILSGEGLFLHQSKSGEVSKCHRDPPKHRGEWREAVPEDYICLIPCILPWKRQKGQKSDQVVRGWDGGLEG